MNQAWNSGQDRRRFFRIDDVIGLHWAAAALEEEQQQRRQSALLDGLAEIDAEIGALLIKLRREQPLAADVLTLMNRKLQMLARRPEADTGTTSTETFEYRSTPVNISACGLAFLMDQPCSPGSRLRLDMLLRPGDWELQLVGRVVACDAVMAGWYVRLDYEDISQSDQDLLVRHMLIRQSQQLKR